MSASPIGTDVDRVEGHLKVSGGAAYAGDHTPADLPGLAHGYVVTSTIGLGTITAIDTTAAVAAPGVLAVYTPFNPLKLFAYGGDQNDEFTPPLQDPKVRYRGQVIGLVVAETFEQARDAAGLIVTTYESRPPSASFAAALPGAPPPGAPSGFLAPGVTSIDDVLAASPVRVNATYTTAIQHHHAMEPHATVAAWTGDHVTLYTVTQGTPLVVSRMAHTLGVDAAKIHVLNPYVGGAFGGKWGNWAHTPLTAAAARALGRPVKTVLTREQVFTVVGHRPQTSHTLSLGATADGVLTAVKHEGASSKSASANFSENAASVSLITYAAPNIQTTRRIVPLDLPATTIMRAPAEANGSFALESAMDELAWQLELDPLELRRRNYAATVPGNGNPWSGKHLDECYRVGAEKFGWAERNPEPGAHVDGDWLVGLGMATATYHASRGDASVKVRLRADGTAVVSGTASDSGTGQSTVFAIVGADRLGIPIARVVADLGDSASPASANAGGSSSTASNGDAVRLAADGAIAALIQLAVQNPASPFAGKDPATVAYADGSLSSGGVSVTFGGLLTTCDVAGVEATVKSPKNSTKGYGFYSFGAHFCEVRVNRWTGEPRVSRLLSIIDAGAIVNTKASRSQVMGGVVMGLGQALLEETRAETSGRFANADLAGYLVPVHADTPHIDVEFVGAPDPLVGALGARGIGELGIVGVAAAIASAVHNATGKRIRELPITLDKLLT